VNGQVFDINAVIDATTTFILTVAFHYLALVAPDKLTEIRGLLRKNIP